MKIQNLFIVLFIFNSIIYSQVELNIDFEKEVYMQGEPVLVMMDLNNNTNSDQTFTNGGNNWQFFVYDQHNNRIYSGYENYIPPYARQYNSTLKPGEHLIVFTMVSYSWGKIEMKELNTNTFPVGKYRIRVGFSDLLIENQDTLRNNVVYSNEKTFSMIEPDAEFNLVLNDIKNIWRDRTNNKVTINNLKTKLNESKNQYRYIYLHYLIMLSNLKGLEELLLEFPNNYAIANWGGALQNFKFDKIKMKDSIIERVYNSSLIQYREEKKAGLLIEIEKRQ